MKLPFRGANMRRRFGAHDSRYLRPRLTVYLRTLMLLDSALNSAIWRVFRWGTILEMTEVLEARR